MIHEEGRSSIKLVIAITVITVIVILGGLYIKNLISKEKVKNMQADLLLVQAKVEIVKGNYNMNKDENPLKGYKINELPENINITEFLNKHVISEEEYEKFYLLDSNSLEQMELHELVNKYSGYFIVNYDSFEVIFTDGYENENGMWCYKITDLHKNKTDDSNVNNGQNDNTNEANSEEQGNQGA